MVFCWGSKPCAIFVLWTEKWKVGLANLAQWTRCLHSRNDIPRRRRIFREHILWLSRWLRTVNFGTTSVFTLITIKNTTFLVHQTASFSNCFEPSVIFWPTRFALGRTETLIYRKIWQAILSMRKLHFVFKHNRYIYTRVNIQSLTPPKKNVYIQSLMLQLNKIKKRPHTEINIVVCHVYSAKNP